MKRFFVYTGIIATIPMMLTGCVDEDYSLSDIDKTTQIRVNNLVLPVNIDPITLNDIIDVDPTSKIQTVTIEGQEFYAVTEHGEINSQDINIPQFTVITPDIQPSTASFHLTTPVTSKAHATATPISFDYGFDNSTPQDINVKSEGIDSAVKEIYNLKATPAPVNITLTAINTPDYATFTFPQLNITLLKGLEFADLPSNYSYNPNTGELTITNLSTNDNKVEISIALAGIDFTKTDTTVKDGAFTLTGKVDISSGILRAEIDPSRIPAGFTPDASISFSIKTSIGNFTAQTISGAVDYTLTGDGLNIDPVTLNDVPDFLNQEGSDLKLANPQIYLNLNNPIAIYNLYYQTGIEFTAVRSTGNRTFAPDNNKVIATKPTSAGPYNFLLSPSMTSPLPEYAANLEHIPFSELSNLLSGNRLPEAIEINLINPGLPLQTVNDFRLGEKIPGIRGSYDFIAPIALKDGSKIIYSKTEDGWSDEDLDKLTIELLSVEADVTSTIPLDATLTAYPIDKNGNIISTAKADVSISANAKDSHILVKMQGPINNLDGITFTANLAPGSEETLSPTQTITLKNLKATVSGYYTVDFD
ncbi:MAG: hypothetical protein K2M93_05065 [Muribaculaceae bacterium]|nr:hypothetical protein [Muribaculaceae bacterium]